MPFTSTAKEPQLTARPDGRFTFTLDATGNPVHTNDESPAVLSRLVEHLGGYWANAKQGSSLYLARNLTITSQQDLGAAALAAVDPLVTLGRIVKPTAEVTVIRSQSRAHILVRWQLPGGGSSQLLFPLSF